MSDMSNYLEGKLVEHTFRNVAFTSPTTVYVALFTAVSDAEAGTGTEVSGGSYARQAVTFGAHSNGTVQNSATVTFPTATADWGTITHFGIFDASSGGNPLTALKALAASKVVNTGDTASFAAGALQLTMS